jgi:hypothetical protein
VAARHGPVTGRRGIAKPGAHGRRLAWVFGSYPAALMLEPTPLILLAASTVGAALLAAGPPCWHGFGLAASGYITLWLLVAVGHGLAFGSCRRRSRLKGLSVVVMVAESPWLAEQVLRRRGIRAPRRLHVYALHVDPGWRPSNTSSPDAAAREFGRLYRRDYDRVLASLCGLPALVVSSTFNRHESTWTARASAEGWGRSWPGPLFRGAPRRHGPRARARQQLRMFGAVVSGRRVDRPDAWRTRLFDCMAGHPAS